MILHIISHCIKLSDEANNDIYKITCVYVSAFRTLSNWIVIYHVLICVGVEIELVSEEGLIDVNEGELSLSLFSTEGFSYGPFVVTMTLLTYSEFEKRGYNLSDSFEADDIPENAANGLLL